MSLRDDTTGVQPPGSGHGGFGERHRCSLPPGTSITHQTKSYGPALNFEPPTQEVKSTSVFVGASLGVSGLSAEGWAAHSPWLPLTLGILPCA